MTYGKRILTETPCQAPRVNDPDPLRQFEMWFAEARAGGCAVPGGDGRGHGNAPRAPSVGMVLRKEGDERGVAPRQAGHSATMALDTYGHVFDELDAPSGS